ncbi:hypothetical protein OJ996_25175 [Luteolibacter sp. GHJ8]|uniref:Uncharacterized protein n=1 Tax=Luteolibacter rhizosphaerae TaxID=2989719 RepID=A0ABT3GAU4_9BACT|nr:hypothetical protein [Luteolibacter rhizosphaerae]MCW1916905.1 hypothetical protein [Luteolibacter rhizosphaerae]
MKITPFAMLALLASSPLSHGQAEKQPSTPTKSATASKGPQLPKTITADQVKEVWVKKLVPPKTLDPKYHQTIKEFKKYLADIKAGKMDLEAKETAATYNRNRAMKDGDTAAASIYEAELERLSAARIATATRKQEEGEALRLRTQLMDISSKLGNLESEIRISR